MLWREEGRWCGIGVLLRLGRPVLGARGRLRRSWGGVEETLRTRLVTDLEVRVLTQVLAVVVESPSFYRSKSSVCTFLRFVGFRSAKIDMGGISFGGVGVRCRISLFFRPTCDPTIGLPLSYMNMFALINHLLIMRKHILRI
jgi:hypothetical protein